MPNQAKNKTTKKTLIKFPLKFDQAIAGNSNINAQKAQPATAMPWNPNLGNTNQPELDQ